LLKSISNVENMTEDFKKAHAEAKTPQQPATSMVQASAPTESKPEVKKAASPSELSKESTVKKMAANETGKSETTNNATAEVSKAEKKVEQVPQATQLVDAKLSPEQRESFFVKLDELSRDHMGLSDKAFVDEVFSRYAQMPSKKAQEQREPQSLAEMIKEDDDDKSLRQSLGAVDEPMLTKD